MLPAGGVLNVPAFGTQNARHQAVKAWKLGVAFDAGKGGCLAIFRPAQRQEHIDVPLPEHRRGGIEFNGLDKGCSSRIDIPQADMGQPFKIVHAGVPGFFLN